MNCELMSPAGNLSSFIAAIDGGADSVYLGLDKFNARRPAQNFAPYMMRKVISYAPSHNCKVYITLNIQLKPNELSEACSMLQFLSDIGADAVIVTDLAVIDMMRRFFPKLEPHFSTQTVSPTRCRVGGKASRACEGADCRGDSRMCQDRR